MSDVWSVPGYEVLSLLGVGASGEVWRGVELASGEAVALQRLGLDEDPAVLAAGAAVVRGLDTPYLVRLRAVVGDVVVLDLATGGSLSGLLSRRGCLSAGEVVTIAAPVAAALACAHRQGLVHGAVRPSSILFTSDGMPLLAGLGRGSGPGAPDGRGGGLRGGRAGAPPGARASYRDPVMAGGGDGDPSCDVWALAAICYDLLVDAAGDDAADEWQAALQVRRAPLAILVPGVPSALVSAIEAGLADEPAYRPDAAAFATLLRQSCVAVPVRLSGGPAAEAPVPAPLVEPVAPPDGPHAVRGRRRPRTPDPAGAGDAHATDEPQRRWPPPGSGGAGRDGVGTDGAGRDGVGRLRRSAVPAGSLAGLMLLAAAIGWVSGRTEVPAATALSPVAVSVLPEAASPAAPTLLSAPPVPSPPSPAEALAAPRAAPRRTAAAGPGTATRPAVPADEQGWTALLDQLDAARSTAFATADATALAAVWADGSAGLAGDTAAVRALAAGGSSAHGLRHVVHDLELVSTAGGAGRPARARLSVVDVLSAYEVRDAAGEPVRQVDRRGPTGWLVDLVTTPAGWRLVAVARL